MAKTTKAAAAKTAEKVAAAAETVAEVKETAKKPAAKKTTARKTTAKKAAAVVKEAVYLQYAGKEISKEDLTAQVKKVWAEELGKKEEEIVSLTLYLKPEENACYYVINDVTTGKIDL